MKTVRNATLAGVGVVISPSSNKQSKTKRTKPTRKAAPAPKPGQRKKIKAVKVKPKPKPRVAPKGPVVSALQDKHVRFLADPDSVVDPLEPMDLPREQMSRNFRSVKTFTLSTTATSAQFYGYAPATSDLPIAYVTQAGQLPVNSGSTDFVAAIFGTNYTAVYDSSLPFTATNLIKPGGLLNALATDQRIGLLPWPVATSIRIRSLNSMTNNAGLIRAVVDHTGTSLYTTAPDNVLGLKEHRISDNRDFVITVTHPVAAEFAMLASIATDNNQNPNRNGTDSSFYPKQRAFTRCYSTTDASAFVADLSVTNFGVDGSTDVSGTTIPIHLPAPYVNILFSDMESTTTKSFRIDITTHIAYLGRFQLGISPSPPMKASGEEQRFIERVSDVITRLSGRDSIDVFADAVQLVKSMGPTMYQAALRFGPVLARATLAYSKSPLALMGPAGR